MLGSQRRKGSALAIAVILTAAGALFLFGLWAPAPSSVQANPSSPVSVLADGEQFKTLRVYGRNNETAGADRNLATDLGTGAAPEDPPYTNPSGPFLPQLNEAPRKDSVTWNPAWMNHFEPDETDELYDAGPPPGFYSQIRGTGNDLAEKVWFRMWYEPEHWDKDLNSSNSLDRDPLTGDPEAEVNPTPSDVDEWYPAIMQEFTYLFVDPGSDEPASGVVGTPIGPARFVFPVGIREDDLNDDRGFGLTSFDADFDGDPDIVRIYSELSLFKRLTGVGADFNANGQIDPLDPDGDPLTGDEVAILSPELPPFQLGVGDKVQFLEHIVEIEDVSTGGASLKVWYNGNKTQRLITSNDGEFVSIGEMLVGDLNSVALISDCGTTGKPFFAYLEGTDPDEESVTLAIGRAVGGSHAAMDVSGIPDVRSPDPWYLKRFYVDGHEYNVVALMTQTADTPPDSVSVAACPDPTDAPEDDSEFQYITIRTPVPKVDVIIEQHSVELQAYQVVTGTETSQLNYLSAMPPFNHEHTIKLEVTGGGSVVPFVPPILQRPDEQLPYTGTYRDIDPPYDDVREVGLFYVEEKSNEQFLGQLKEKYGEVRDGAVEEEFWYVEQFFTLPWRYTEFVLPDISGVGERYLLTSAFTAPQAEYGFPDVGQIVASDIFTWTTANGQVQVDVNVFNNCAGDLSRYQWEYEVQNNTYSVSGGNGLSGFHVLFAPQIVGDVTDQSGPADWTENSHATSPPNGVAWDIQDQPGIQPGESGTFSFCTLPRTPVQRPNGEAHTWIGGSPAALFTDGPLLAPGDLTDPELSPRVKFWFDPAEGAQDPDAVVKKYKDENGLRVYGDDGWDASPGLAVVDAGTALATETFPVEVKPYAIYGSPESEQILDPFGSMAPFNPQLPQAPVKDSLTFNPAYMNEFRFCPDDPLQTLYQRLTTDDWPNAAEKVFFRMWYEPDYLDGVPVGSTSIATDTGEVVLNASDSDTFLALMQEFTYMLLDPTDQPTAGQPGESRMAFPMATKPDDLPSPAATSSLDLDLTAQSTFGHGINSFDADFDLNTSGGAREAVTIHSEQTISETTGIAVDFDGDGDVDTLDPDGLELSGDELVILAVNQIRLEQWESAQFLDNMVTLTNVPSDTDQKANFMFWYTGGGPDDTEFVPEQLGAVSGCCNIGDMVVFHMRSGVRIPAGGDNLDWKYGNGAWFMWLKSFDPNQENATIMIGRALGATHSAMYDGDGGQDLEKGDPWYLKRFFVDGHEYNVVAVKTAPSEEGDSDPRDFKYITIRTPVPKEPFTNFILTQALQPYGIGDSISVMPPFNTQHTRRADITRLEYVKPAEDEEDEIDDPDIENFGETENEDCIGEIECGLPLGIDIVEETTEPQFSGSLGEIFVLSEEGEATFDTESFQTLPNQYTDLALSPDDQLYLLTSSWRSDQSQLFFYACMDEGIVSSAEDPLDPPTPGQEFMQNLVNAVFDQFGTRVKFWYDPNDEEDIYVNHFTLPGPDIIIEKSPATQTVLGGSDVTFTITVTNTGDAELSDVTVSDVEVPDCDIVLGTLAAGSDDSYTCTRNNVTADFTNTAVVTGTTPADETVSDDDTAEVQVINPDIDIDKSTDTPEIVSGEDVTFTITVTNTGDVELTDVTVDDDTVGTCDKTIGTLAAGASDQYTCTETDVTADFTNTATVEGTHELGTVSATDTASVYVQRPATTIEKSPDTQMVLSGSDVTFTITVTNTGEVDLTNVTVDDEPADTCDKTIGALTVGDSDSYTCTETNVTADFTNTATVTGDYTTGTVIDDDTADVDVISPDIMISKAPDTQQVVSGSDATFTITVTNTGDVDLTDVAVSDPLVPDCDKTIGDLTAGSSNSYTCTRNNVTADFTNTATATGTATVSIDVSDDDTADVEVINPDVTIDKAPDTQTVVSGDDVTFTITVTNTGDVELTNVIVTDALVPDCDKTIGTLAAGADDQYTCTLTNVTAGFTNVAAVEGDHPAGGTVSDTDSAQVFISGPDIAIDKAPNLQTIPVDSTATFTITVTNTGDVELTDVTVSDALAPDCDKTIGTLAAGADDQYTCTEANVTEDFTNTAIVTGTHGLDTVSDTDSAEVNVAESLTCSITGNVFMQGRTDHTGVTVRANGPEDRTTTTGSDGLFAFSDLPTGDYIVTASHPGYLSAQDNSVQCQADATIEMPETWILGGDANNDKDINLFDLITVAAAFNTCSGDPDFDSRADIRDTGCVDIFDLVLVGVNYGMTGPTGWPTVDPPVTTSAVGSTVDRQPSVRKPYASLASDAERFDLRVENVNGMYGIDVRLTFDTAEVRIVDADPERPGIQIEPGPLFAGSSYFPAKNRVQIDEKTGIGTVEFVAALLNPAEPIAGSGVAATILFEPVDAASTVASTALTIEDALLADPRGRVLPVVWEGDTIRQVKGHLIYLPIMAR